MTAAHAQAPLPSLPALERARQSVVGITSVTNKDASTSEITPAQQRRGSGVVIDEDGLILSIGYLTLDSTSLVVTSHSGISTPARMLAYDATSGLSLLKPLVPQRDITVAPAKTTQNISTAESVWAAYMDWSRGEPVFTATRIVSRRAFSANWEYHLDAALFTSPVVNQHAGSALFSSQGELLGIGHLRLSNTLPDQGNGGLAMAGNLFVPIDTVLPALDELRRSGSSRLGHRPWLGINSSDEFGRIQVLSVHPDGPAKAGGLATGDLILAVDGQRVGSLQAFYKRLWAHEDFTQPINLTVMKGVEERTLVIGVTERIRFLRAVDDAGV